MEQIEQCLSCIQLHPPNLLILFNLFIQKEEKERGTSRGVSSASRIFILEKSADPTPTITIDRGRSDIWIIVRMVESISVITPSFLFGFLLYHGVQNQ